MSPITRLSKAKQRTQPGPIVRSPKGKGKSKALEIPSDDSDCVLVVPGTLGANQPRTPLSAKSPNTRSTGNNNAQLKAERAALEAEKLAIAKERTALEAEKILFEEEKAVAAEDKKQIRLSRAQIGSDEYRIRKLQTDNANHATRLQMEQAEIDLLRKSAEDLANASEIKRIELEDLANDLAARELACLEWESNREDNVQPQPDALTREQADNMVIAAKASFKTDLERILECGACFEPMVDAVRLSCGHAICKNCQIETARAGHHCMFKCQVTSIVSAFVLREIATYAATL